MTWPLPFSALLQDWYEHKNVVEGAAKLSYRFAELRLQSIEGINVDHVGLKQATVKFLIACVVRLRGRQNASSEICED